MLVFGGENENQPTKQKNSHTQKRAVALLHPCLIRMRFTKRLSDKECLAPMFLSVTALASLGYEKTCVLFNAAALASQIASEQNLDNDEGLKAAAKYYQVGMLLHS